jgi:hypothetical protein
VNIHTHQAEEMLEYFEHEAKPWGLAGEDDGELDEASDDGSGDGPSHGFQPVHRDHAGAPPGPRPPSIRHISV